MTAPNKIEKIFRVRYYQENFSVDEKKTKNYIDKIYLQLVMHMYVDMFEYVV